MRLSGRGRAGIATVAVMFLLMAGCTRSERAGRVETRPEPDTRASTIPLDGVDEAADAPAPAAKPYDLEAEMPVEDTLAVAPEEDIEFERVDTTSVRVEEAATGTAVPEAFALGYRVQVFASRELAAAKAVKERIVAEGDLATYIEYEDGLYKVRVGDFESRDAAAAARVALGDRYPDCWIVQTTVRR
ncbi:MAG: SPOR domain-containing protein [Candidatus Krumholzibacteriota bacterium]|nr:SPOR domain-containing protein [Candidatus Krumholzibacteriota bacterium]